MSADMSFCSGSPSIQRVPSIPGRARAMKNLNARLRNEDKQDRRVTAQGSCDWAVTVGKIGPHPMDSGGEKREEIVWSFETHLKEQDINDCAEPKESSNQMQSATQHQQKPYESRVCVGPTLTDCVRISS